MRLGNYHLDHLNSGMYDIEVICLGHLRKRIENIPILTGKPIILDINLTDGITHVTIKSYLTPLVYVPNIGCSLRGEYIRKLPILHSYISIAYSPPIELSLIKERIQIASKVKE